MGTFRNFRKSSPLTALLLAPLLASVAFGLDVPAGTQIQIRLKAKISTLNARADDPVEAVVIAPANVNGQFVIPTGAVVRGTVTKVTPSIKPDERAVLLLTFTELEISGVKSKLAARVAAVDNAREKVDDQGQINGILASDTITGKIDAGIGKVAEKYSGFAGILGAVKDAVLKPAEGDIVYDAGVEMTLKLTAALTLKGPSGPGAAAKLQPVANERALIDLVSREPFQTVAQNPPKPSDITNLMLIGTQEQVKQAFADGGWTLATGLNARAKFETLRALAEDRGYSEAPVSVLMLDGKPPDIVFEKLNDTFARRHHLRVWQRPAAFQGKPVWAVAATHDMCINFSEENRTFIHRIDSQIDTERAKVVNDLLFTGHVQSVELVDRPKVPQKGQNATGDNLETDGKIAVLVLQ